MSKPYFGILDYQIPKENGLYLLGQTAFDPYTNRKYYLIKVGMAKNIYGRLKQYCTYNPNFWIIDTLSFQSNTPTKEIAYFEKEFQKTLFAIHNYYPCNQIKTVGNSHSTEWFCVNKETYNIICDYSFLAIDRFAEEGFFKKSEEWEKAIKERIKERNGDTKLHF